MFVLLLEIKILPKEQVRVYRYFYFNDDQSNDYDVFMLLLFV